MTLDQAIKSGYPFKHSNWKEWKDPGTSACGFDVTILEAISNDWQVKYPPLVLTLVVDKNGGPLNPRSNYSVWGDEKYLVSYYGCASVEDYLAKHPTHAFRRFIEVTEDKE